MKKKYIKKVTLLLTVILVTNIVNAQWVQVGNDIFGEASGDYSGWSVSINSTGNIIAIGSKENDNSGNNAGQVRVFNYDGTNWVQIGSDINGEGSDDESGFSISINSDGNTVAIGAFRNDGNGYNSGHVRIYSYNGTDWIQDGSDIDGEAVDDISGRSVSLSFDGNTVAIGAPGNNDNGNNSGHVRIFHYDGVNWIQVGSDIDGEATDDGSGQSVCINADGNIVAIGAYGNDDNGNNSGHVRVYNYDGSNWIQVGNDINGEATDDYSGWSISLNSNGNTVAIGAYKNDDNGNNSGHVRIYNYNGSIWSQVGSDIDGEAVDDFSGFSVDICSNGSTVAIGAYSNDGNGHNAGHVRIYHYNGTDWIQIGTDIEGDEAGDYLGVSVNLNYDGSTLVIGAYQNDYNGSGSGLVKVYYNDFNVDIINLAKNKISIYPNPTTSNLIVEAKDLINVSVYSYNGILINSTNRQEIDLSKQIKGIYFVKITTINNIYTQKLILE